jgi:hypothetical protein
MVNGSFSKKLFILHFTMKFKLKFKHGFPEN